MVMFGIWKWISDCGCSVVGCCGFVVCGCVLFFV